MFFETVIYDSKNSEIYFRHEVGDDQSLGTTGGTPSTSYVENIFNEMGISFVKYTDPSLNNYQHKYDWPDTGFKVFNQFHRRLWIAQK
jgi:hypothetical protein